VRAIALLTKTAARSSQDRCRFRPLANLHLPNIFCGAAFALRTFIHRAAFLSAEPPANLRLRVAPD
jgi:hypothetical protein